MSDTPLNALLSGADGLAVSLPAVGGIAAALLLTAGAGWRRLPAGVRDTLVVAGSSGVLSVIYLAAISPGDWLLPICILATGLAVLWFVVGRWVRGGRTAALACGLIAAGLAVGIPAERLGATACLAVLLILTVYRASTSGWVGRLARHSHGRDARATHATASGDNGGEVLVAQRAVSGHAGLGRSAIAALLGCILHLWVPPAWTEARGTTWGILLLCTAAGAMLVARIPIWQHWRYRRGAWKTEPLRLIEQPPAHAGLMGLVLAICAAVGVGSLLAPGAVLAPLALALASLAAFTAAHWSGRSGLAGELGLTLLGGAVILAIATWLPNADTNLLLGGALTAGYLLWLAWFWHQQLHEGTAWTTAGRLIEPARRLAYATAYGCFAVAVMISATKSPAADARWPVGLAVLVLLVLALMLLRDARGQESQPTAACLAMLAAAAPAHRLCTSLDVAGRLAATAGRRGSVAGLARGPVARAAWIRRHARRLRRRGSAGRAALRHRLSRRVRHGLGHADGDGCLRDYGDRAALAPGPVPT